jgi:phage-related protein
MAGSFRIAEGYVEVTADESGYDRAMDRLRSKRNTVKIGVDLDDKDAIARLDRLTRTRFADVRVRLDGTALARLRNLSVVISPKISDSAARIVQTRLDRLTADRVVNIRASVDTRVAAAEIRNLVQRRQVRIGIDVDTRVAADSLANLTRRRQMTVGVNLDDAAARARLDLLARNRTTHLRVDVDSNALSGLSSAGGAGGALSGLVGSLSSLTAVATGAFPMLAALGTQLAAMAPAALVAVPAVLSLGAAFAAIKIGTSGIGDAFKAAFAPAASSAHAAASATRQVENAQRSLAKAQQGVKDAEVRAAEARVQAARQIEDAQRSLKSTVQDVADANRRAAQQVAQAERDLADAQRSARQAQQDLTAARKDAARQLQDLANQQEDVELDRREAVLRVQDAQDELNKTLADPKATEKQRQEAQLTYDQAVQHLEEVQLQQERLTKDAAAANKAGVEGSKQVTDAKQQVADANRDVADKTRAVAEADREASQTQIEGAQKVADAERSVADAREAARKAAVDGARDIKAAQESVADAARSLAEAQTAGAAAVNKTAEAMAKLAPNAREFVSAVIAQAGAWRALKLDVQNALFAGLGQKFTTMSQAILPSLTQGLTGTASVLNRMAKNAADTVTNLGKTGMLKQLFAGLNGALKPLERVPGQFLKGLTQIGIAASPAFKRITTAAGGFFDRFSKQIDQAAKNGHLEQLINRALDVAKQVGRVIGDIFGTLSNVMGAASKAGGDALGGIGAAFKELRRITAMPEVQKGLTSIFTAINSVAKLLAGTLGKALGQLISGFAKIAPTITSVVDSLSGMGPVVGMILLRMNPLLGGLMLIAPILGKLATPIAGLIKSIAPILQMVADFTNKIIVAIAPVLGSIITVLSAAFTALSPVLKVILDVVGTLVQQFATALTPVIGALVPVVQMLGQFIAQLAPVLASVTLALLPLLPPIAELAVSLLNLAMQVIGPLLPLIAQLATMMAGTLADAIGILVPVITTVIGWITNLSDAVASVVKWIVDKFTWLYDVLVGHSIIPDLVKGIIGWFGTLWTKTREIFNALRQGIVDRWNALWKAASDRWNSFWTGLRTSLSNAKTSMTNWVSGVKTSLTSSWSSMWSSVTTRMTSAFTTLRSKLSDFKTSMLNSVKAIRDGVGSLWAGIQSRFSGPVKWVISNVYNNGLRKMWNSIAGKINSKITLPTISLGFSEGGVVPGKRSNRDSVPAMLAPGERVLSNGQVDQLGGHRGIDAMLGKDRPAKTGGNPSRQEERKRYQGPVQHFADGGIIGKVTGAVGGAVSSAASWAKDLVVGGLKDAAMKALSALVRPLIARIPGGAGLGGLLKGLSNRAVDGMMSWFTTEDKKAKGGPAVQKALSWAKSQSGLPYQWAGNGNPSWDCSGFMSAIESVIRGERPHRRWATGSFPPGTSGWVRNLKSPFEIGITNAGVGHTAGTLAGVNFESSGGRGVHYGKTARGAGDPMFTSRWGFAPAAKYDEGGLLADGATMVVKQTRKPERVLSPQQTELFEQLVNGARAAGAGGVTIEAINFTVNSLTMPTAAEKRRFATDIVREMKEAIRVSDRSYA